MVHLSGAPGTTVPMCGDPALVKALPRASRWRRLLETGSVATVTEFAAKEKVNASYVSRIARLTLPAPDIVEAMGVRRRALGQHGGSNLSRSSGSSSSAGSLSGHK